MTTTLCIDPGTTDSGIVVYDGEKVLEVYSSVYNDRVLNLCRSTKTCKVDMVLIEMVACNGMPVGKEIFETCVWIGRFMQEATVPVKRVFRKDIKMQLCNSMRAKDGNIRQALLDRFPKTGGGKTPQVGVKKQPGPLFGVSSHAWSALAIGVTWFENPGVAV